MALVESAEGGVLAAQRGATLVRLRAPHLTIREQEHELAQLVAAIEVPVVATSRVDLALAAGARGVHLVEGDIRVADAREMAPALLIGRSVHSVEAVVAAVQDRPDYLLLGPIWATPSHPGSPGVGLEVLRAAAAAARPLPILAVGGVDEARTERVMRTGAAGWAAIRMYA